LGYHYHSCIDCSNLDKKIKKISGLSYLYGCKRNNFTCGWMRKDSQLNDMGCSMWGEIKKVVEIKQYEQISLF